MELQLQKHIVLVEPDLSFEKKELSDVAAEIGDFKKHFYNQK